MRLVPLKNIAPPKAAENGFRDEDIVWQLTLDQIESDSGRIVERVKGPVSSAGTSTFCFDEGNVLYSKLRPYLNKVICPDEPGIATTELVPLRPIPGELDRDYLCYYLRSPQFVHWVSSQVAGAKMPRVSMKVFWNHEIPVPHIDEQKRIAAILDKADAIRRKRAEAIRLADDFLKSAFLDMFGDPETNSHGYPLGSIRDLVSEVRYGTSKKAGPHGEYPILRMGNITYGGQLDLSDLKYIDLEQRDIPKYTTSDGDILFNRTNSKDLVGKTAVFRGNSQMAIAGYLIRVRVNKDAVPDYISGYLNSAHGKSTLQHMCKNIVGMANINAQELQDIPILKPPMPLQQQFAEIVERTRKTVAVQQNHLSECDQLFGTLAQRAFRGEL